MRGRGIKDFMIQSGGDLYVAGAGAIARGAPAYRIRGVLPAASSQRWT